MVAEATVLRYRDAAVALLPPGAAYSKEIDSNIAEMLEALTVELARIHEGAAELRSNRTPLLADAYLADWEDALGLPGSCVTTPSTVLAERRGAAVAKLLGRTSHNRALYEQAAAGLGYDDLEFELFMPATCTGTCLQPLYGDEWANVVRISVLDGDQLSSEELVCVFTDQLRRAHGFIVTVLEGAMGAVRVGTPNYFNNAVLSADMVVSSITALQIKYSGTVAIQCRIDNGALGAPTDTPVGVWELWCSSDGTNFTQYTNAAVVSELAKIAPNGNNVVNAWAFFEAGSTPGSVPGTHFKLVYNRTSGGGTDARATVHIAVW